MLGHVSLCACAQILDQGNSAFSSQQFSTAIPFFNFVKNVTRKCSLVARPIAVFASQFGPDSDGLTELATINGSSAYYISPDILSDNGVIADQAASNDTSDPLGADQGEAALDFYGSPYSNLPTCASLNAQVEASSLRHPCASKESVLMSSEPSRWACETALASPV